MPIDQRHHATVHKLERRLGIIYGGLLTREQDQESVKGAMPYSDSGLALWIAYALAVFWALYSRSVLHCHMNWKACRLINVNRPHPSFKDYVRGMLAGERDGRIPIAVSEAVCEAYSPRELPGLVGSYWRAPSDRSRAK